MEDVELLAAAPPPPPPCLNKDLVSLIAKGKRTKRQRPLSPVPLTITSTPTHNDDFSSATSSEESTTTEELDTARCLILLSQGYFSTHYPPNNNTNRHSGHAAAASNKGVGSNGSCVYTCKTCNRSFPSFQALGGHRTSHKKPRNEKSLVNEDDFSSPSTSYRFRLSSLSLQLNNASTATYSNNNLLKASPSPRMHECSYCGAEFTSGQALGGHMRKHRAGPVIRSPDIVEEFRPKGLKKPEKFGLSLDLNFPAPEDEKVKSPQETNQRLRLGLSHHHHYSIID